mgnify:CR=1 FL=1|tara:strand:- start:16 stop:276 length:261 start_codon:yes stop_codon:yes gene_type:complete
MTTKHLSGSAAALRGEIYELEDKLAARDATIAELRIDVSNRDKTIAKHEAAKDVRKLAGIVSRQTERIELLETAVEKLAEELAGKP